MPTEVEADLDAPRYLDRIGVSRPLLPTLETLRALVAGHNRSIPFENLDPLMGIPVADLRPGALAHKRVHRRRGAGQVHRNAPMGRVIVRVTTQGEAPAANPAGRSQTSHLRLTVIVGVQPDRELSAALGVAGVELGVGPFVGEGAVEAFDAPMFVKLF
jgi:N-acetyltransferase